MGKSNKIIKSLILGAKAFSKDRSGVKKEQSVTNKIKNQWSVDKSYSCGYDPADDTDDRQDSKSNEHIDHGIPEGGFASVVVESALQSETTVVKPIHEDSEVGLSDTVVKPDNFEELAEEQGSVSRTNEEISIEENAAIVIQAAFRGFLGRRAFRAIKAAQRFQDLADGQIVKQQTTMDSRCMQALIKVQARVRARQVQMSEEGQAVQQQIQHKRQLQTYNAKFQEDWDHSLATFEELQAKLQNKQNAAIRREKALAYASLQQLRICGQRKNQQIMGDCIHSDQQPHLSWTWLERWMAARPSDNTELEKDIKKNNYHYLDDNKQDTLTTPQYGKIKRNKKKIIGKQPILFLSPTTPLPYNNPITMKTPSPTAAKSSMSRTTAKSIGSSGHESPKNNFGDPETGTNHHMAPRKLLFNGDENNKDHVEAEESCGSNVICSSPEIKAKADSSTKSNSHDPKLRHKSSSENGPTKLGIPNYMSTTKSSKAKVHHWNDPPKPNQPPILIKSTPGLVLPCKLDAL